MASNPGKRGEVAGGPWRWLCHWSSLLTGLVHLSIGGGLTGVPCRGPLTTPMCVLTTACWTSACICVSQQSGARDRREGAVPARPPGEGSSGPSDHTPAATRNTRLVPASPADSSPAELSGTPPANASPSQAGLGGAEEVQEEGPAAPPLRLGQTESG